MWRKWPFPYSYLDKLIDANGELDQSILSGPIPSKELFTNDLRDPRAESGVDELSQAQYDDFLQMTRDFGINSFGALLAHYNLADCLLTHAVVAVINRFYFAEFGLTLLRFSSLSKFAFTVLLKGATDDMKVGVETLMNVREKAFLQRGVFGGLFHTLYQGIAKTDNIVVENSIRLFNLFFNFFQFFFELTGGKPRYTNGIDFPGFLSYILQRLILSFDINSLFPHQCLDE